MSGKVLCAWTAALIAGAAAFIADAWTKAVFFNAVREEGASFSFLGGFIRSTLHRNEGISFNLPVPTWAVLVITGIALGWAIAMLIERGRRGRVASSLIIGIFIGGVLGNAYDRLILGYVRDWLLLFGRSAINLADILIAGSLLLWLGLASRISHPASSKNSASDKSASDVA